MIKIARKYFIAKPISLLLVGTILFQIVFPTITFALTSGPTTPEVQSFEPIGTTQLVDPFSGDFNYNIPLMDVGGYPINLHYHAGIGMDQEASWVGLGWNINPGVINRNMRGIPDDFNGDEIKYKYNIKENNTYSLSLNKKKEFEILGFKKNDKVNSFSLIGTSYNLGFIYNNYKGVGYTVDMDYDMNHFGENHASFRSSSIGFSSIDGFNISSPHKKYKNSYVGVDYNSRYGLENFHFNRTKNFDEIDHSISNSMIIPFQNSNYSPVSKPNFLQVGASLSITTGNESYGIFQKNSKYTLDASKSYLSSDQKSYSRKAYGYLNDEYADINSVMDKQNSGGYGFDRFSQYIGMSTHAYDLFNVSGQGIAGQYRPTRNQLGILWDARQEANSSPFSNNKISIELGKGKVDPTQLEIGADYTTVFSWGHSGKANLESKLSKNYMSKDKKELKEPVYFKNLGDLTFLEHDFYEDLKEENAFKISIEDIVSNFPSMPPQYYWDKYNGNINIDNSNLELKNETLQIKDRQKRNNVIQYLNTDEAKMYGSKTVNIVSQGNNIDQLKLDEFNYDDLNSKHLSEITTLGGDGSRYVYGLPALNKKHIEANFSVEKPLNYDNNTGLIKYSSIDASVSNTKGLDNFYQSTELPQYAYAYHLTAIFSPDYADVTGNGPTPDDFGSYTKFNYEKIEGYNWRAPFKDANLNKGLFSNKLDDRANYLYGEKDIWILRSVETKTHVAIFITSDREDAMGPAYEQNTNDLSFIDLNKVDYSLPNSHYIEGLTIGILVVLAASIKCAQFPFSSWLPRALEGPTVSSAIFYGSLSLHVGLFLLLRTFPIWENIDIIKILIGVIGLLTAIVSYYISTVQSTTKTQLAYASITQVGLMFIEIALGWHSIALVHFALHAFYRTYQFLVSPSSLSYLIHDQFLHYDANKKSAFSFLPNKLRYSLYTFSIMEGYLDRFWFYQIWRRFKKLGVSFNVFRNRKWQWVFALIFILSVVFQHIFPIEFFTSHEYVPYFFSFIALILILLAWTERKSALNSWINIVLSQLFFMDGIVHQGSVNLIQIVIYLTGVISAAVIGGWALKRVISLENNIDLNSFHGHIYEHKKLGMTFLLCSLILIGFPISPTFLGLDLLFSEIEKENTITLIISALVFIFLELASIRIYARVFLGLHVKPYHEVAFKSS